jgi:hypothetical protein
VAIAPQPAMTAESVTARPPMRRSPHELVPAGQPPRAWTVVKISCLVAVTALCIAFALAMITGAAFFTMLNLG